MVGDVVWVWVLNPKLKPKKVYKKARIACAENIEKHSRLQQNNPDNETKHRDWFDFEKQVNANSMSLSWEEKTKVRSLCTKYEVIFSRNISNDMGFCDRIYNNIKLKKDAVPFRRTYSSMSFENTKATKKNCWRRGTRQLSRTKAFWLGSTIITCTKKGWKLSLGCRLSRSEQTNRKSKVAFTTN